MTRIRWGVLSTAGIGMRKVIPAMQKSRLGTVTAIASRSLKRAQAAARKLNIPLAFASYEALLESPDVDAIYIPLPNSLHVHWSRQALEAGKHVLCEKPIALSARDTEPLLFAAAEHPDLVVAEAFMYRHHPQWVRTRELVQQGVIGTIRAVHAAFAYCNKDPRNIRNKLETGGGALLDIGCYGVSVARYLFGTEPRRVSATMQRDAAFGTDILASALLDFGSGTCSVTCATQLHRYQRVEILGDRGNITIDVPFNAPPDASVSIRVEHATGVEALRFEPVDQYSLQADAFALAIRKNIAMPTPLEDAMSNMRVIDGLFQSASRRSWVAVSAGA